MQIIDPKKQQEPLATQQTNGLGFAWDIESHSRIQSILSRVDHNFRNIPRSGLGATPPLTQS